MFFHYHFNRYPVELFISHKQLKRIIIIKVSIIIISYNASPYIKKCITSFQRQSTKPFEILFVDNCSTDNSIDLVEKNFPKVTIIANKRNMGYSGAINIGIKKAQGDYFVLANPDLYVDTNWLTNVVETFNQHAHCGLVASKVLYMDEAEKINSTGMLFFRDLSAINRGMDEFDHGQFDQEEEVFGAYGAIMIMRKEVFQKVGLFDEDYFLFREEDEFMWRMNRVGFKAFYNPKAVAYHKRSANTELFSPLKLYYSERNRFWNVLIHMPLHYTLTTIPFVLWRYGNNFLLMLNKKSKKGDSIKKSSKRELIFTLIKAWYDAFIAFPRVLKKRFTYEKFSTVSPHQATHIYKKYRATSRDIQK